MKEDSSYLHRPRSTIGLRGGSPRRATALPLIAVAFSVEEPTLQAGVIFYCVSRKPSGDLESRGGVRGQDSAGREAFRKRRPAGDHM